MNAPRTVRIAYFSDLLCVWAYVAQIKLDELKRRFADRIVLDYHYLTLFGNTRSRVAASWRERGGIDAYNAHIREIATAFPHVTIHPEIWRRNPPASSLGCHLFLKAVALLEERGQISAEAHPEWHGRTLYEETAWRLRLAFFRDLRDIGRTSCQLEIAEALGLPCDEIQRLQEDGSAHAAFTTDLEAREKYLVRGSPTLVLNEGRQILYGNIGYKIIEANINELLQRPSGQATWC